MTPADLAGIRAEIVERNRIGAPVPEWLLNCEREADAQVTVLMEQREPASFHDWWPLPCALAAVIYIIYRWFL